MNVEFVNQKYTAYFILMMTGQIAHRLPIVKTSSWLFGVAVIYSIMCMFLFFRFFLKYRGMLGFQVVSPTRMAVAMFMLFCGLLTAFFIIDVAVGKDTVWRSTALNSLGISGLLLAVFQASWLLTKKPY